MGHFRFSSGNDFATSGQRQNWSLPKEYDMVIMGKKKKTAHTWRLNKETKGTAMVEQVGTVDRLEVSIGLDFLQEKKYISD